MSSSPFTDNETSFIVRAESLAAWRNGEQFLAQAREQADAIQAQAVTQAQALREQARREGYEDGRREAMEAAAAQAMQIATERQSYLMALESRLIQVLDMAFRKILAQIPDADLVASTVRRAVEELRETGRFTLRVAPGMAQQLREEMTHRLTRVVSLHEDETLQGSQCYLETATGSIELTPHAQWERILQALQIDPEEHRK